MIKLTNRTKGIIGGILLFIVLILFLKFSSWFISNWWVIILFLIIDGYFLGEGINNLLVGFVALVLIAILIGLLSAWRSSQIFFGFVVNNEFMLVILTFLYVVLTYINFRTIKQNSEMSRLPYLNLRVAEDLDIYLTNDSKKMVKNIDTTFQISIIKDKQNLMEKIIKWFKDKRNYKKIRIDQINEKGYINTKKIFEGLLPVIRYRIDKSYDDETYKLKKGEKEFKIKLNITCTYSSDTGFETENPIEKKLIILFKKNKAEIQRETKEYGEGYDIT
ncbi:MAG: hypothetical protein PHH54_03380 [Candidatus Nanoarchaeia archaeon]|nr:hypothetical protein [Candidatus Nanoarchaeia archaeon]MDD5740999.1 hypothetical protein [Candidatus Nanoarchaeia archaeon]